MMNRPILLIHGFGGDAKEFHKIADFLRAHGADMIYEFTYQERYGQVSLREIAGQLDRYIIENIDEPEFDMIGISQGGIIARYQIAKAADNKVRKCITLCSPHHGSWLAYLAPLPGIKDLRPNSRLLQELDNAKAQYHAVYNPLDLMVFPGWSAKLEAAQENKRIYSPLHQLTFKKKETFNHILSILNS